MLRNGVIRAGVFKPFASRALVLALLVGLPVMIAGSDESVSSPAGAEARKQPMRFTWHAYDGSPHRGGQNALPTSRALLSSSGAGCEPFCAGFVAAVGTVTADTPKVFEDFASKHDLRGATILLNSGGGSVLDTLTIGRRWRALGVRTTVGMTVDSGDRTGEKVRVLPDASCESMCAFLLLSGVTRHVPEGARVRVHQIWMGDRATNAKAASYTAQDMTIVQRDVGKLAQYTFEMGGSGALLSLALSIPPWEPLYELSPAEMISAHLVTGESAAAIAARDTLSPVAREAALVQGNSPATGARTADAVPSTDGMGTDKRSIEARPQAAR